MPVLSKVAVGDVDDGDGDDLRDFIVPDDAEIEYEGDRPAKKKSDAKKRKSAIKNQKSASEKQKTRQSKSAEGSASSRKSGVNNDQSAPDLIGTKRLESVNKDKIKATWKLWEKHEVRPDANDLSQADADKLNACIIDGTMLRRVAKKDLRGLLNSDNFYQYKKKLYITIPGFKASDYARAAPQQIRKQLFGQPLKRFSYRQWLAQAILYGHPPLLTIPEIEQAFIAKIRANEKWDAWPSKFGDEFSRRLRIFPDPDDRFVKVEDGEDVTTSTGRGPEADLSIPSPAERHGGSAALRSPTTVSDGDTEMDLDESPNYAATPRRASAYQEGDGEFSPTTTRTRSARKEAINRVYEHPLQEGLSIVIPRRSFEAPPFSRSALVPVAEAHPEHIHDLDPIPQQADGHVTNDAIEDVTEQDLENMSEKEQIQRAKDRSLRPSTNVNAANFVHSADLVERESQASGREARETTIELPFHTKGGTQASTDADAESSTKKRKHKKEATAAQHPSKAVSSAATARSAVDIEIDELRISCAQLREWARQLSRNDAVPLLQGTDMQPFQLYLDPDDSLNYLVSIGGECFSDFMPVIAMGKAIKKFQEDAIIQIRLLGSLNRPRAPGATRPNLGSRRRTTGKEIMAYIMSRHPHFDPKLGPAPKMRGSGEQEDSSSALSKGESPSTRKRKSPGNDDNLGNTRGHDQSRHSAKKAKVKKNSVLEEEEIDTSTIPGVDAVMSDVGATSSTSAASQRKTIQAAARDIGQSPAHRGMNSHALQQSPPEKRGSRDVPQADEPVDESFTEPSVDTIDPASLQNAEGRYVCRWKNCASSCKTLQDLFMHAAQHELPHDRCRWNKCGLKGLDVRDDFVRHLYSHVPYRVYRCDKCDNGYAIPSSLRSHFVNWHTGFAPPRYDKATLVQISPSKPDPSMTRPSRSKAGGGSADGGLPSASSQRATVGHASSSGEEEESDRDEDVSMTDQVSMAGNDDVPIAGEGAADASGASSDRKVIDISDDEDSTGSDQEDFIGRYPEADGTGSRIDHSDNASEHNGSADGTDHGSDSNNDSDSDSVSDQVSDDGSAAGSASSRDNTSDSDSDLSKDSDSSCGSDRQSVRSEHANAADDESEPPLESLSLEQHLLGPHLRLRRERAALTSDIRLREEVLSKHQRTLNHAETLDAHIFKTQERLLRLPKTDPLRPAVEAKYERQLKQIPVFKRALRKTPALLRDVDARIAAQPQTVRTTQLLVDTLRRARAKKPFPPELLERDNKGGPIFAHEFQLLCEAANRLRDARRNGWTAGTAQMSQLTNRRNRLDNMYHHIRDGKVCTVAEAQLLSAQADHGRTCAAFRGTDAVGAGVVDPSVSTAYAGVLRALKRVEEQEAGKGDSQDWNGSPGTR
ncbi:uncharacterized protein AB675_9996 [Cyphellophora attinorum]|uniref:C2H2-type domain-containing protein n=1 Tax=Cyphellophora attinorum TaxID=1664694 RepID=A0A0N0NJ82_9EURO|nr:uncharacterized protein AB675_9996 [Phialophora attinorum]KPI36681.1 hypothetical protein AB675_9996 [Phialophora attinorum]